MRSWRTVWLEPFTATALYAPRSSWEPENGRTRRRPWKSGCRPPVEPETSNTGSAPVALEPVLYCKEATWVGRVRSTVVGLCVGLVAGILIAHALAVVGVHLLGRPIVLVDPFLGAVVGAAVGFLYAPRPTRDGGPTASTAVRTGAGVTTADEPGSPSERASIPGHASLSHGGGPAPARPGATAGAAPRTTWRRQTTPGWRWARLAFLVLAAVFVACVVVQILLAGLAVFSHPLYWARHVGFVHVFELLPLAMLLVAVVGGLPRRLAWLSAGLLGLIFLMYFSANLRAIVPVVAAFHPVLAMVLFMAATQVAGQAWALYATADPRWKNLRDRE